MTLYEINNAILETVDPETGEIIDVERLNALEMERDTKISNVACWIKDLKAENEAIKAEKQNLTRRQETNDKKMESLKRWLDFALNGEKFKDGKVSISYRKSESVQFSDSFTIESLPSEFIKVTAEPMKSEIKQAIKDGRTIEGCFIREDNNIQIR